jgi:hypothetical protein
MGSETEKFHIHNRKGTELRILIKSLQMCWECTDYRIFVFKNPELDLNKYEEIKTNQDLVRVLEDLENPLVLDPPVLRAFPIIRKNGSLDQRPHNPLERFIFDQYPDGVSRDNKKRKLLRLLVICTIMFVVTF